MAKIQFLQFRMRINCLRLYYSWCSPPSRLNVCQFATLVNSDHITEESLISKAHMLYRKLFIETS